MKNRNEFDKQIDDFPVKKNPVYESGGCYIIPGNDGAKGKQLTNFVMEPTMAIACKDTTLMNIIFKIKNGRKIFVEKVDATMFSNASKFKTAIKQYGGIDMVFDGSESNLVAIQEYMNNRYRNYIRCDGNDYNGLYKLNGEWIYIGFDGTINKKGQEITDVVSIVEENEALNSDIIHTDMISKKELREIAPSLFHFNTYERSICIIGWVCACFLKERLKERKIKFPHLVLEGAAGSGKSETMEKIIQPIFGLTGSGIACTGLTKFSMLKSTSSTNTLPLIFEEYKPHKMKRETVDMISGMLRDAYDSHTDMRGRANQTVTNYPKRCPICLVGEASFNETAVLARILDVQFAESDREKNHTDHFMFLKSHEKSLNKLGKSLLLFTLNISDEELDKIIDESREIEDLESGERVLLSVFNCKLGILFLEKLFASYGLNMEIETGITWEEITNCFVIKAREIMSKTGAKSSDIDRAIQKMDNMAVAGRLRECWDYIVDKDSRELCLRIKTIYDDFTKYLRECNVQDISLLSENDFRKQLRKEKYFKSYVARTFKTRKDGDEIKAKVKCFVLDLNELNKHCELEAFSLNDEDTDENGFMVVNSDEDQIPFLD